MARSALCSVQVGRDREVARLSANRSGLRTTLIAGAAGVGKSRLSGEAVRQAEESGWPSLVGHCEPATTTPYGPFVTALRRRTRTLDDEAVMRLFAGPALLAAALLPEVARSAGLPSQAPEAQDLFAATWHVLKRVAGDRGCLLLVEDLHWADPESLRMFSYLARETQDLGVWLVGTYRTDDLHRRHPLTPILADLARSRAADEIVLKPLDREELRTMVSSILDDTSVGDEFLDALLERTEGNPFFVEELIKVLLERGDIYREAGDWARRELADIEMPATIREALLDRCRTMDRSELHVLELAAVAGERLDPDVLARAAGTDVASVETVIGEGLRLQLLSEQRDGPRTTFRFRHALTREAFADELIGPARQDAHRRVAEAIAQAHGDVDAVAAELAEHYSEAGDAALAVEYGIRAARLAVAGFALEEAGRQYERALRSLPLESDDRLDLMLEAAEALQEATDRRLAVALAEEARTRAGARREPVAEARSLMVLERNAWLGGDTAGALRLLRAAHALLHGRDDRLEARALARLSRLLTLGDERDEATTLLDRGIEMAERTGEFGALSTLYGTRMMGSHGHEFEEALEAAVTAGKRSGDGRSERNLACNAGFVHLWRGELDQSLTWFERAVDLYERFAPQDLYAQAGLGWLLSLRGRYAEALAFALRAEASQSVPSQIVGLTARYEVLERRDDPAAPSLAEQLFELASKTGETQRSVPAASARARAALLRDGPNEASALFWDAMGTTTTEQGTGSHWSFSPDFARALAEEESVEELERWVEAVQSLTEGDRTKHNEAAAALTRAYLFGARAQGFEARRMFEQAANLFGALPCPVREAESLIGIAETASDAGDTSAAAAAAGRALAIAEGLDARAVVRRARQVAARAQAPAVLATVLVTDMVRSTERLAAVGDRAWAGVLERHHALVRRELEHFGGREIDTAGDGFLAVFDTPAAGIRCALSVRDAMAGAGIAMRCGLHTGECQVLGDKVVGLAVHIAARVSAEAAGGDVLVSGTVRDLVVGSGLSFSGRGVHELKGVPGSWALFAVED